MNTAIGLERFATGAASFVFIARRMGRRLGISATPIVVIPPSLRGQKLQQDQSDAAYRKDGK